MINIGSKVGGERTFKSNIFWVLMPAASSLFGLLFLNRFPGCNIGNDLKAIAKVESK